MTTMVEDAHLRAGGAKLRTINMSRDVPCYLISEPELNQLANPDRLAIIGQVSTTVIGAAVSAAFSFVVARSWGAFAVSLVLGAFALWVAWESRRPKQLRDELVEQIKKGSYAGRRRL